MSVTGVRRDKVLLVPSIAFMPLIERFLNTEMLAKVG